MLLSPPQRLAIGQERLRCRSVIAMLKKREPIEQASRGTASSDPVSRRNCGRLLSPSHDDFLCCWRKVQQLTGRCDVSGISCTSHLFLAPCLPSPLPSQTRRSHHYSLSHTTSHRHRYDNSLYNITSHYYNNSLYSMEAWVSQSSPRQLSHLFWFWTHRVLR